MRCFFNWLVASEYLEKSPFRTLRNVKLPQKIVRPYEPGQISALLEACDTSPELGLRDKAIVLTLLDTGTRCPELVKLNLEDLDLEAGRLRILHAKGNKQRVAPFASNCRRALQEYLDVRGLEPGLLFLASTGHKHLRQGIALRPNGLKQIMKRLGARAWHRERARTAFSAHVRYLGDRAQRAGARRSVSSGPLVGHGNNEQAAHRHAAFSPGDALA